LELPLPHLYLNQSQRLSSVVSAITSIMPITASCPSIVAFADLLNTKRKHTPPAI